MDKYNKLNKKAVNCMFIATLIESFVTIGVLVTIWIIAGVYLSEKNLRILQLILISVVILQILYLLLSPKIRYKRYKYCINEEKIDVVEGFIFIERNIVPIERLHKIAVMQGPIDRYYGLAKVKVTTAGGDVILRFLEEEKANVIAEALKKKINDSVIERKNEVQ